MLVWDDLNPSQRLSMYDRGVALSETMGPESRRAALVSYRTGDMVAPPLGEHEALGGVVKEFHDAIVEGRSPLTDGWSGLRVLRVLDAASRSLDTGGAAVPLVVHP